MPRDIRIDTPAKLLAQQYELAAHCWKCERWAVIDLVALVAAGRGDRSFDRLRPRCAVCGRPGAWQVRPPAPFVDGFPGGRQR